MPLILASSSSSRRAMLDAAGVSYIAQPSTIDESDFKRNRHDPKATATSLAEAKALDVSRARPGEWVIGSDSVISVDGRLFDKPRSRGEAADHLRLFSSKMMQLVSAVALVRSGMVEWIHCDSAALQVRVLDDQFIDKYLGLEWPAVSYCVGVFRIEGRGVHLFDSIDGDQFTILGMPLVPLLGALRERGLGPL